MKSSFRLVMLFTLALLLLLASGNMPPSAAGAAPTIGWDTISVTVVNGTLTLNPGGSDYALANDLTTIRISGSGTFGGGVAPTGGGTWAASGPSAGTSGTASGMFTVTGLVRFAVAPGSLPPGLVDNISDPADARSGLAVLRIKYSDGSAGTLTVSCSLPVGTPSGVFEGITATKGFVDFHDRVPPVPGVDANRTQFHIVH